MKKISLISLSLLAIAPALNAQTTITFKPAPTQAQDARIWKLDGGCIPSGYSQTPADINFGSENYLGYADWTWSALGCDSGTYRILIRFDQLATIPATATVLSAQLKLYGLPPTSGMWGNNYFPGTPLNNTNEADLFQVNYNQPQWYQNTVTWNTQPGTIGLPVAIPVSTAQWNWDVILDVTQMVQDMVANPAHNHGFLMKLQQEIYYRGVNFASSNHADSTLWPALVVNYKKNNAGIENAGDADNGSYKISGHFFDAAYKTWHVNVHAENMKDAQVFLYDITGKKIISEEKRLQKGNNELQLPAANLAGGIYILEIRSGSYAVREKLLCN